MAFSKTPTMDTYSTQEIPLAYHIDIRPDGQYTERVTPLALNQDAGMVNLLPMKRKVGGEEELVAIPRPASIVANAIGTTVQAMRGFYVWEKTSTTTYFYAVCGVTVYTATAVSGPWTARDTLLTVADTPVRFAEFINSSNVKSLVLVDGVEGYVYLTDAVGTKITDLDFPTPHIPFPVFVDGYLFLAKQDTGDIYNSDLNNPASWTAGNFISSELYPDDIQALVKVNNYILAIGTEGSEYFYDAGNASGSPLARQEGASLPFGTKLPSSIASNKNMVTLIANFNDGEPTFVIIEDFKYKVMNGGFVIQTLANRTSFYSATACRGFLFRYMSKLFYGIRLAATTSTTYLSSSYNTTYVYSFDTDGWTEFRMGTSNEYVYPGFITSSGRAYIESGVSYIAGTDPTNGKPLAGFMRGDVTGLIDDRIPTGTTETLFEIRTPNFTFGTLNRKFMHRFGIFSDMGHSSYGARSMSLSWNDYDYDVDQWATARTITYNTQTDNFPFVTQLGLFRRRALKLTWAYFAQRMVKAEVDINKGQA